MKREIKYDSGNTTTTNWIIFYSFFIISIGLFYYNVWDYASVYKSGSSYNSILDNSIFSIIGLIIFGPYFLMFAFILLFFKKFCSNHKLGGIILLLTFFPIAIYTGIREEFILDDTGFFKILTELTIFLSLTGAIFNRYKLAVN